MISILIFITFIYMILIMGLIIGYYRVPLFKLATESPKTRFSVVIPFRNEAKNLEALLRSLDHLNYPRNLFELILVDDQSSDNSEVILKQFVRASDIQIKTLQIKRTAISPKKEAITAAIDVSNFEWIITTDADCQVPVNWLSLFDACIQLNQPKMIAGPLSIKKASSVLEGFQWLDIFSLQSATVGGFGLKKPFLCNGANLAYKKDFFNELEGFSGNINIASGDDVFMLEKALKHDPDSVTYLKSPEATVTTNPESSLKDLIQQRLRWASKTTSYKNVFGKIVALSVILMNLSLLIALTLVIVNKMKLDLLIAMFAIKVIVDFWLLYKSADFFDQKKALYYFPLSCIVYPFFTIFIGIYALFSDYKWKGRTFSK